MTAATGSRVGQCCMQCVRNSMKFQTWYGNRTAIEVHRSLVVVVAGATCVRGAGDEVTLKNGSRWQRVKGNPVDSRGERTPEAGMDSTLF